MQIVENRKTFLDALRSGKCKKGCITSDDKGYPVFKDEADSNGHCCCAIMVELFGGPKFSVPQAAKALGITSKDCAYIQKILMTMIHLLLKMRSESKRKFLTRNNSWMII